MIEKKNTSRYKFNTKGNIFRFSPLGAAGAYYATFGFLDPTMIGTFIALPLAAFSSLLISSHILADMAMDAYFEEFPPMHIHRKMCRARDHSGCKLNERDYALAEKEFSNLNKWKIMKSLVTRKPVSYEVANDVLNSRGDSVTREIIFRGGTVQPQETKELSSLTLWHKALENASTMK